MDVRLTHIGGPTVLIEFAGWRLLTDPTFDPSGGKYRFGAVIPIHYEGWRHFRQGRDQIEAALAAAPADLRERVRWLPIGGGAEIGV